MGRGSGDFKLSFLTCSAPASPQSCEIYRIRSEEVKEQGTTLQIRHMKNTMGYRTEKYLEANGNQDSKDEAPLITGTLSPTATQTMSD